MMEVCLIGGVKNPIGDRLRVLRTEKKLSQENIALELGISKSTYSTYETGKIKLTIDRLQEIAKILDVEISEIIIDDKRKSFNLSEPSKQYGFATKSDIEELSSMIKQLKLEFEKFKTEMRDSKKVAVKKSRK